MANDTPEDAPADTPADTPADIPADAPAALLFPGQSYRERSTSPNSDDSASSTGGK